MRGELSRLKKVSCPALSVVAMLHEVADKEPAHLVRAARSELRHRDGHGSVHHQQRCFRSVLVDMPMMAMMAISSLMMEREDPAKLGRANDEI